MWEKYGPEKIPYLDTIHAVYDKNKGFVSEKGVVETIVKHSFKMFEC